MKRIMILILAVLLLSGCEEYATYTPSAADLTALAEQMPEGPTKDAVVGTAVARYEAAAQAENTITAAQAMESAARADLERVQLEMTAEAQQTAQAQQAIEQAQQTNAQSTIAALDTRATTIALNALETAQADDRNATATADARNATVTAEAKATAEAQARATSTMQASVDSVEKTRQAAQAVILEATAQRVARQTEIDQSRQTLTAFGGWAVLLAILFCLIGLTAYLAPVIKARLQVVRRKHDETEPMIVTLERVTMPLRQFFPVLDLDAPQLAPPELQDRATARTQLANVVSAARGSAKQRVTQRPRRAQAQAGHNVIQVVEPGTVRDWLDDARGQLVEIEGGVQ